MSTETVPSELVLAKQLPPDLMLLKMENETMMAAAAIRPRDYKKVMEQLRNLIDAYPEFADDAIYCKPVGKVFEVHCHNKECRHKYEVSKSPTSETECPRCYMKYKPSPDVPAPKKVQKYAEGLSIRAAESIRSLFGYNRLATSEIPQPDGKMKLQGVFVDFAAATITLDERTVSNYYTAYDGTRTLINEDRFLNITVKGEKSKLRRDVILGSVPSELKAGYMDACNKKLAELLTDEKVQEAVNAFASYGISEKNLEELIGRPRAMGWTTEDRVKLRKIHSALKNEEITAAELLADLNIIDAEQESTPKKGKRVRESSVDLSTPNGATGHVTDPNLWKTLDMPPGVTDLVAAAVKAKDRDKVKAICLDGRLHSGESDELRGRFQSLEDSALADIEQGKDEPEPKQRKKQGSLVE